MISIYLCVLFVTLALVGGFVLGKRFQQPIGFSDGKAIWVDELPPGDYVVSHDSRHCIVARENGHCRENDERVFVKSYENIPVHFKVREPNKGNQVLVDDAIPRTLTGHRVLVSRN